MNSNSQRVRRQRLAIPITIGAMAAVLWPVSYGAAVVTNWQAGASFADLWMGLLSMGGLAAAAGTTIGFGVVVVDAVNEWVRE